MEALSVQEASFLPLRLKVSASHREEQPVMPSAIEAKIIVLQSHPVWAAAQKRAHARSEAMRRHPSFLARRGTARGVIGDRLLESGGVKDDSRNRL